MGVRGGESHLIMSYAMDGWMDGWIVQLYTVVMVTRACTYVQSNPQSNAPTWSKTEQPVNSPWIRIVMVPSSLCIHGRTQEEGHEKRKTHRVHLHIHACVSTNLNIPTGAVCSASSPPTASGRRSTRPKSPGRYHGGADSRLESATEVPHPFTIASCRSIHHQYHHTTKDDNAPKRLVADGHLSLQVRQPPPGAGPPHCCPDSAGVGACW